MATSARRTIQRPPGVGVFQFVVLSSLRAAQLIRGCLPRVDGTHKAMVMAQIEVAEGKVTQLLGPPVDIGEPVNHMGATLEDAPMAANRT